MNSVLGSPMGWRWHAGGGAALKTPMVFNVPHLGHMLIWALGVFIELVVLCSVVTGGVL